MTEFAPDTVRVMVVDDSAVIRGFLTRFIEEDPKLKVVASAPNGQMALNTLDRMQIDVVVLDIEMPIMDGLTALPLLLQKDPNMLVMMASTLTKENAAITMRCFKAGAAECLAKPTSSELAGSTLFKDTLVMKIKELGAAARKRRAAHPAASPAIAQGSAAVRPMIPAASVAASAPKKFTLRQEIIKPIPDVVAIGSSTGGPQALLQFFGDLKKPLRQPIFVTQHMPPTFTTILAENITKQTGLDCKEAAEGDKVEGGRIYIAPGNYHMTIKQMAAGRFISLNQDAPENFCRPAVDPMLRSLISVYGKKILTVILTGMGSDGMRGSQLSIDAGGIVIAQDEATSVVWGMPGAVAMAGICTHVLPLGLMAKTVREYADRMG